MDLFYTLHHMQKKKNLNMDHSSKYNMWKYKFFEENIGEICVTVVSLKSF